MDWRVIALTIALAVVTGLLFGRAPALHAARSDISNTLRAGTSGLTRGTARARSVLVLAEISLATVLLIGAGLPIHSFERLTRVDPGFRPNHLVVFDARSPARNIGMTRRKTPSPAT